MERYLSEMGFNDLLKQAARSWVGEPTAPITPQAIDPEDIARQVKAVMDREKRESSKEPEDLAPLLQQKTPQDLVVSHRLKRKTAFKTMAITTYLGMQERFSKVPLEKLVEGGIPIVEIAAAVDQY